MKHMPGTDPGQRGRQQFVRRRHPSRTPRLAAASIAWVLIGALSLQAQDSKPNEYQVKAAYLYNFGRFVEWPAKAVGTKGDSFAVCVLGVDPFGPTLDVTLAGETIRGSKVVAKRISRPQEAVSCRILFVSSSESSRLKEVLEALGRTSVLTVGDMSDFALRGGMVQFVLDGSRVRFEVNLTATERVGLALSSELLKVALRVKRSAQLGD
jgi:YfiR/HmsC-like